MLKDNINKNKFGISLIVLIITIIVVIILAAVVILTLSKNNPIESAKEASFKEDIRAYQDELNMYITKEYQSLAGQRDSKITATGYEKDSTSEEYNNSVYKYLSSFKKKYENKIAIENDEIVYIGRDKKEREWTNNIVKMNPILTVKYVYENGEEAAPKYEETVTDGSYEVDSPIIEGYEPDHYTVSDKIDKDTEITVTYYPWSEGLAYEELDDGTYTVAGIGTFTGENLVVPREYNRKDVTKIKSKAFLDNLNINKIIINSKIINIEEKAFQGCSNIKSALLNAKILSYNFLRSCKNVESVIIEKNVNIIGRYAFEGCSNLNKFELFSDLIDINSDDVFSGCYKLKEFKINKNNSGYIVIEGILYTKDMKKIIKSPYGREGNVQIPITVTSIYPYAFQKNKLVEINIPNNVDLIQIGAFRSCTILNKVVINANRIGTNAFRSCTNLTEIILGNNVKNIDGYVFEGCSNITSFKYEGTKVEWNSINKTSSWNTDSNITKVICSDGEVDI